MTISDFRDMYLTELQEARSGETQLIEALPRIREAATDPALRQMVQSHLAVTRAHSDRIGAILNGHGAALNEHEDQSMRRLIDESEKWTGMLAEGALRDAGLIASAQRIEHYQIAVYGTLATWAKQLGLNEDLAGLLAILDEEKAADDELTALAKGNVNPSAAG